MKIPNDEITYYEVGAFKMEKARNKYDDTTEKLGAEQTVDVPTFNEFLRGVGPYSWHYSISTDHARLTPEQLARLESILSPYFEVLLKAQLIRENS